ncbi:MAG: Gfo/Idh/MocA family protein [Armatimonadota bacterium]
MRIGVLGAGGIVPPHLDGAKQLGVEVVHIADVRIECAKSLADQFGIKHVSDDPWDVVKNPDVDMVIVALPTYLHSEWLKRCAAAGKHILTEKPLCRTVTEARQVIKVCGKNNVKVAVGYQRRFSPARIKVRELIRSDAIGRPVTWAISGFSARNDFYRGPNNWMWDMQKGAGLVMDGSIHDFDFASWVLGKPAKMYAQSRLICDCVTAPTQASAIIHFEQGDTLTYSVAWQECEYGAGDGVDRIIGPKGTIIPESEFSFLLHNSSGSTERLSWEPTHLFKDQLGTFIKYAVDGVEDYRLTTGEDALSSLWIAENIVRSGENGRLLEFKK